ncbi:hypothetical protein O2K51_11035 [Apibacter raozihei]|uniref:hypothetical protein n=1 Tax=Apibacter raozihei TaxID=2500547 RepID=UPI000FE3CAAC|nr:hypothetical protein [Apibacter raozihei]
MYNPTRRNRNIGTAKQGSGQNNKLVIPGSTVLARKSFYERIGNHKKIHKNIKGNEFVFIVEETRKTSEHACTVNDVVTLLNEIPPQDLGELKYVIFRQPKRKEEILSPVWGRLIYSYDYENEYYPAIILDAIDYEKKFKWKKKLSIEDQKEISRLQQDGHKIIDNGKYYLADYELEYVKTRNFIEPCFMK